MAEPVPKASVCPICKAEVATEATVCGECGCSLRCEKSEDFATQGVAYRLYMHLQDTAVSIVTDLLHRTYTHQQGPPWAVAVNGEVIIYLDCYPIELMQFDDYAWLNLIDAMKALPAVTVIAHVMRRHTGHPQVVLEVLKKVLSEFRGVAQDQSGCCWTPERPVPSHDADRSLTPASGEMQTTEPRKQQEETTGWGYVEVGAEKPAECKGRTCGRASETPLVEVLLVREFFQGEHTYMDHDVKSCSHPRNSTTSKRLY